MFKSMKPVAIVASLVMIGSIAACGPADSKEADPDVARSYDVSHVQKMMLLQPWYQHQLQKQES